MKKRLLPEHDYLPCELETQPGAFVDSYNHCRYRESLLNAVLSHVYYRRAEPILRHARAGKQMGSRCRLLINVSDSSSSVSGATRQAECRFISLF